MYIIYEYELPILCYIALLMWHSVNHKCTTVIHRWLAIIWIIDPKISVSTNVEDSDLGIEKPSYESRMLAILGNDKHILKDISIKKVIIIWLTWVAKSKMKQKKYSQTWYFYIFLHRRIFRPKILHRKSA